MLLLSCFALLAGLVLLIVCADRFVEASAALAQHLGLPPLLVGLLVVGVAGCAPELMVAVLSAAWGRPGLALGTAWGSGLVNMALILGVTAWVAPLLLRSAALKRELPMLIGATVLSALLVFDGVLSRWDAAILLLALLGIGVHMVRSARALAGDALARETASELRAHPMGLAAALGWGLLCLLGLLMGSGLMVWGAADVAGWLGLPDLLVGLSVLALATSLPELAACVAAARRGEHGIALGQVLGASLLNLLGGVGLAGLIAPMDIAANVLWRELPLLAALSIALFAMAWSAQGRAREINRREAQALVGVYGLYLLWLLASTRG
jgi:cation:H+ antiporter